MILKYVLLRDMVNLQVFLLQLFQGVWGVPFNGSKIYFNILVATLRFPVAFAQMTLQTN